MALSFIEVEYVTIDNYCAQILWIKYQLEDYEIKLNNIPIQYGNKSIINLSKNPILHSRIKHIKIRHHFIKEHVLNGDVFLEYICTKDQLTDIFTKPLSEERFSHIRKELDIFDPYA